jgi:hypothetical protein
VQRNAATGKRLPPNAGKGRKKDVPNRVTGAVRELFQSFVERNAERAQDLFDKAARRNPARALELLIGFAEFCVPKLTRMELKDETPRRPPVTFQITFPNGGPGQGNAPRLGVPFDQDDIEVSADEGVALPAPRPAEAPVIQPAPALPAPPVEPVADRGPVVVDVDSGQYMPLAEFEKAGRPAPPRRFEEVDEDAAIEARLRAAQRQREAEAARRRSSHEEELESANERAREQQRLRDERMRDEGWPE